MKPYFENENVTLYFADCREVVPMLPEVDVIMADPPYGETRLEWDTPMWAWMYQTPIKKSGSMWCFGSQRMFLDHAAEFSKRWHFAQDIVWEKHNGSNSHKDRFRRVHELALHFYEKNTKWEDVYKNPVYTLDAAKRSIKRSGKPQHWGQIGGGEYSTKLGGKRLMRSVMYARSCHGYAIHPTQKPLNVVKAILDFSCPLGGLVFDPMCGAATTLVAAEALGMKAIGCDNDEAMCEKAANRLAQGVQLEL